MTGRTGEDENSDRGPSRRMPALFFPSFQNLRFIRPNGSAPTAPLFYASGMASPFRGTSGLSQFVKESNIA